MNKRILVIDDDPTILEALKVMLEQAGYSVEATTKDGPILHKRLLKETPDLILLDVLLSGYDGRHIAKELKTNEKTSGIPLIMMSAHPDASLTCIEAGADIFIPKPFDINDLLKKIKNFLEKDQESEK